MNTTPTRATRKGHAITAASTFLYYGRDAAPAAQGIPATLEVSPSKIVIRAEGSGNVLGRFGVAMLFWAAATTSTAPAPAPQAAAEPTRRNDRGHGTLTARTFLYYGHKATPAAAGILVRTSSTPADRGLVQVLAADSGAVVDQFGPLVRFWAAPAAATRQGRA
jgi:hypothetical protein